MVKVLNPRAIDFIQDAKPPNQTLDGVLWLRTSDFSLFTWDNGGTRWLSPSSQHIDFTGPETFAGVSNNSTIFAYHHENQSNNTGKSLRTHTSYVIQELAINAQNTPPSDDGLEVLVNGTAEHTLNWDGSNNWETATGLDVEVEGFADRDPAAPNRVAFRWTIGTTTPASSQRMRGTAWYKWMVPGD